MANISDRQLHLVSFDIPYPANYGGAIDIFYKLENLKKHGARVHLHCYQYDRSPNIILDSLCESVHYYKRDLSWTHLFSSLPFIVKTRSNLSLLDVLTKDDFPILFEGLHSCATLRNESLKDRRKIVRTHNIEHEYYKSLGNVEKNPFKKQYFYREAHKLKRFEQVLRDANGLAAISIKDKDYFTANFPGLNVETVSAFHPFNKVNIMPGKGDFALYHGSLEVGENNKAALFLIREVFNKLDIPLKIAGNKPSRELISTARQYRNVELITDVSTDKIYELIRSAQVNVLPTFQATGIKLKLLAALFTGRHCLVNQPMIDKTGLESLCHVGNSPEEMYDQILALINKEFTEQEIEQRRDVLEAGFFSNSFNIEKLGALLFD